MGVPFPGRDRDSPVKELGRVRGQVTPLAGPWVRQPPPAMSSSRTWLFLKCFDDLFLISQDPEKDLTDDVSI